MLTWLLACGTASKVGAAVDCIPVEYDPADVEPPASESEVWAVLSTFDPTRVDWSISATDDASPLAVALSPGPGDIRTVVYESSCDHPGTATFVPVTFDVIVGDDDVVATILAAIDVFSAELDQMRVADLGAESSSDAVLSARWLEAAADSRSSLEPDTWRLGIGDALSAMTVDVSGSQGSSNATYWRGTTAGDDTGG